jgi:hypothetical protein
MNVIDTLQNAFSSFKVESIDKAYIGLVGGIIGSFTTFVLTGLRQWRIERKQTSAARLMLRLEVEQNIDLLKKYWEKVNQIEHTDDERDIGIQRLNSLILFPMPEFSANTWRSQTVLLASALKKNEISQIHYFYSYLTSIKMSYSRILESGKEDMKTALAEREANLTKLGVGFFSPPRVSQSSWNELEKLICQVTEDGNPLHK